MDKLNSVMNEENLMNLNNLIDFVVEIQRLHLIMNQIIDHWNRFFVYLQIILNFEIGKNKFLIERSVLLTMLIYYRYQSSLIKEKPKEKSIFFQSASGAGYFMFD